MAIRNNRPQCLSVQYLLSVFLDFNLLWSEYFSNDTVLVSDECCTEGAHCRLAVHFLLSVYAKFSDKFLLCIGNEWERQVVLCDELLVAFGTLYAHPHDSIAFCEKTLIVVAKIAGLVGTSGVESFG